MSRDFYSTAAQVLPVLLLALVWESRYLEKLPTEQRRTRHEDPENGVKFWTKARVRIYALTVVTATITALAICLLVLGGVIPNLEWLGFVTVAGLLFALGSLMYRIWYDIILATHLIPGEQPQSPAILTHVDEKSAEKSTIGLETTIRLDESDDA